MAWLLVLGLLFGGCGNKGPETAADPASTTAQPGATGNLTCVQISRFSGGYVEDGSGDQVRDVAAILVANNTGKFLELATVTYKVGDRTATFQVTGLPAGRQAWVMESDRMVLTDGDELVLEDCKESYNANAMTASGDLQVSRQGNSLTLTNTSGKKLSNVAVYYKNTMEDGTFLGGITYYIAFGDMEPGTSATQIRDHFDSSSEIVRFSYQ